MKWSNKENYVVCLTDCPEYYITSERVRDRQNKEHSGRSDNNIFVSTLAPVSYTYSNPSSTRLHVGSYQRCLRTLPPPPSPSPHQVQTQLGGHHSITRGCCNFELVTLFISHSICIKKFHTLHQANYLFHFLRMFFFLCTKLDPKAGIVLDWRLYRDLGKILHNW